MLDFSKQFAIIQKLKSLTKIAKSFRLGDDKNSITEDIAKKIQKNAYEKAHIEEKETFTPPYKEIAAQLQVKNEQIFKAAVYNMSCIAINRKQYRQEIIRELEKSLEIADLTKEQIEYVNNQIAQIKQH